MEAFGSPSISGNSLTLSAVQLPPGKPGIFFFGPQRTNFPFGEGRRCVGGATSRIQPIVASNGAGVATLSLDFTNPYGSAIFAGSPGVSYQFWFRDGEWTPTVMVSSKASI